MTSKVECVGQDLCACEMSDGTGTINLLHLLNNPLNPMKDESNPTQTIFYNPCSPVATPDWASFSLRNARKFNCGFGLCKRCQICE